MTLPNEELNALTMSREFLRDLLDPKATPKVPMTIRAQASRCLRHFPYQVDLERAYHHSGRLLLTRRGVQCLRCKDKIFSASQHDYRTCTCGKVSVDGGMAYLKVVGNPSDWKKITRTI